MTQKAFRTRVVTTVGVVICLIGAGLIVAGPASASPTWSIVSGATPVGTPRATFSGVSCSGTTTCFAAGTYTFDENAQQAMIKRLSGTTWSVSTVPSPAGAISTSLDAVKCQAAANCFAVGKYHTTAGVRTLVEHWNGTAWAVQTSATPAGLIDLDLNGVACVSATSCLAVGSLQTNDSEKPLGLRLSGSSWTAITMPNGASALDGGYSSIACPGATTCFAVGEFSTSTAQKTLAARYNGSTWALSATPNPSGTFAELDGVTCVSTTSCLAVGGSSTSTDKTLAERLTGSTWSIIASANVASFSILRSVACVSASSCYAVGETVGSAEATLIEHYNGTSFATMTSANVAGADNSLVGVACAATNFCLAVGGTATATALNPLLERWNTSWTIVATPALTGTTFDRVGGVSCFQVPVPPTTTTAPETTTTEGGTTTTTTPPPPETVTNCMAVGDYVTGSTTKTASQKWNGATWTGVVTPNAASATKSSLSAIACPSNVSCFAVGESSGPTPKTLIVHGNATTWTTPPMTSPNPAGALAINLNSVACSSGANCFAVGSYQTSTGATKALIEHWNGANWSLQTSPTPSGATNFGLNGVTCPTATSCFAVGNYDTASTEKTLIMHWNGTSWTVSASPNPAGTYATALNAISCPASNNCVAAGSYTSGSTTKTLIERWSGSTWTVFTTVNPSGSTDAEFLGLSCPDTTHCFATGRFHTATGNNQTVIGHWVMGNQWTVTAGPNPAGATGSELNAVQCASASSCFAVGDSRAVANRKSLIERYA